MGVVADRWQGFTDVRCAPALLCGARVQLNSPCSFIMAAFVLPRGTTVLPAYGATSIRYYQHTALRAYRTTSMRYYQRLHLAWGRTWPGIIQVSRSRVNAVYCIIIIITWYYIAVAPSLLCLSLFVCRGRRYALQE